MTAMIASIITQVNLRGYGRVKDGIYEGHISLRGGRRHQVDTLVWRTSGVRARLKRRVHVLARDTLASGRGMKLDTESRRD